MTLGAGTRLGPYEIQTAIGAGGMGEVYKARDTRLDRSVAIKVLPPQFSADPERRTRFEREAKTIAGLSHPHICTLHDVGEHEGSTFLVMEFLMGETLAQRLEKGPLPLEQALGAATEIADALAAAHRQGVIHRDLKPGNVMLTKAGAKLLDFGLAKLKGHGEQPAAAHLASAPTQSTPLTAEGMIVGTLPYMAPEQLEGKPADARTDLWALGAILYEMVTGKRAFEGTSAASLIGAILEREPTPLAALQPLTPPGVDRIVRRCLAKQPEDRWDTAHDVADELRWMRETSGVGAAAATLPGRVRWRRGAAMVVVVTMSVAVTVAVMLLLRPHTPPALPARLSLDVRPAEELNAGGVSSTWLPTPGGSRTALVWTPDGHALVYVGCRGGVRQLYVRGLDAAEARPLAGTEGAQVPAVSADGQWVAFWAGGAVKKVPIAGGPAMELVSGLTYPPFGLVWGSRGRLFFGKDARGIWAIPAMGTPVPVTTVSEAEVGHTLPWPLPGEDVLLYTVRKRIRTWGDEEVVAQTLATGERKVLLRGATDARYVPTGHLVFLRGGVLFAVPFDSERLTFSGAEVPMLDPVAQALVGGDALDVTGAGQLAIAATGMLAWLRGPVVPYPDSALVTVDRHGQVAPLPAPARSYAPALRLSPDRRRLALSIQSLNEMGLWVYDVGRGTLTLLAGNGEAIMPIWRPPDGQHLVFRWLSGGRRSVAMKPADADSGTPPQVLAPGAVYPSSFTPDGRQLAAVAQPLELSVLGDIVIVTVDDVKPGVQPLLQTPKNEMWPEFSPDGRWLAYGSDLSGRLEVYVRPYPGPGRTDQVSVEGGESPGWHPNGRELFYLSPPDRAGKRRMMAVEFESGTPPRVGSPRLLFDFDPRLFRFYYEAVRSYDVAPDGQRFYVVQQQTPPPPPVVTHINLIQNWLEELRAKVPTGR